MAKRVRGNRGGHSRKQLGRHRERTTVNDLLTQFKVGERVVIDLNSEIQSAMPHPRFQGRSGTVVGTRGDAYEVSFLDGGKEKMIVTTAAHLMKV
jgi:large subunit ribosomal protein L21e